MMYISGVRDRLTGEVVYQATGETYFDAHKKSEKWCKANLGERGAIIDDLKSAASALGKKGGASRSEAKRRAAKENGKKGGRPKKVAPPEPVEVQP
jgi:hypothetical protein